MTERTRDAEVHFGSAEGSRALFPRHWTLKEIAIATQSFADKARKSLQEIPVTGSDDA